MTLEGFLLQGAQPGYEQNLVGIARRWVTLLGPAGVAGLIGNEFTKRVADLLESPGLDDPTRLTLATDMGMLSWWRSPAPSMEDRKRYDATARLSLERITAGFEIPTRPLPKSKLRRAHVLFAGMLMSKMHSPSGGAIDYAAALTLDPQVQRLDIIHNGEILPDMAEYIKERLGGKISRSIIKFISTDKNPHFLTDIIEQGPCTFHNWCESKYSIYTNVANKIGPMLTFTCGDEPPIQYADVFWYFYTKEHMEERWRLRGAPNSYIANYVRSASGPCLDGPPPEKVDRASIGLKPDAFVITTVGNRLAVEMDEAFLMGMVQQIKATPKCVWLVVGALTESLTLLLSTQLGSQFIHIQYENQLARLMTTVDLFANPFRSGGGNSVNLAIGAGAVTLTCAKGDVSTLVPPEFLSQSPDEYFIQLKALIDSPAMLAEWKSKQFAHNRIMRDQRAFLAALQQMIDLAGKRYNERFAVGVAA